MYRVVLLCLLSPVLGWEAGFAMRNLSPSPEELANNDIYLGGFGALGFRNGNLGFARGVHDDIEAQAFYLGSEGRGYAHVVVDSTGMGDRLITDIRNGAHLVTGIPEANILVSSTHTHCGPDLQGLWGGVPDGYRKLIVERSIEAIFDAWRGRVPANLFVSADIPGEGYNRNRRGWEWAINTTTVLDVRDSQTDVRIGTIVNFAAHPVTLGGRILELSGDYVGFVKEHVRAFTDAPVVYVMGPIGDVSPGSSEGSDFDRARSYGQRIGDVAIEALRGEQMRVSEGLTVRTEVYQQATTNLYFLGAFYLGLLSDYYSMVELPDGSLGITTSVGYLSFGEQIEAVTFPGEALTRNAEPIVEALSAPFALLFGLTQDTLGYLVPSDEWNTGRNNNYEESISMDENAGDGVRDRLLLLMREGRVAAPTTTNSTPAPLTEQAWLKQLRQMANNHPKALAAIKRAVANQDLEA